MTRIEQTLHKLQPSLTKDEVQSLRKDSLADFFKSLVGVYEAKAGRYLTSTSPFVKKRFAHEKDSGDAATTQRVAEYAYAALLQQNSASLLPSLIYLLKQQEPQLIASLGLAAICKSNDRIYKMDGEAAQVFRSYMGRHRLFMELGAEDLKTICDEGDNQPDSAVFPKYLREAFAVQQVIGQAIEASCQRCSVEQANQLRPQILASVIQQQKPLIYSTLYAMLNYIGMSLKNCQMSSEVRDKFFSHLDNSEKFGEFLHLVVSAYVTSSSEQMHAKVLKNHSEIYGSEDMANECRPALRFLGMKMEISTKEIEKAMERLEEEKQSVDNRFKDFKLKLDSESNRLVSKVNEQIDERLAPFSKRNWGLFIGISMSTNKF